MYTLNYYENGRFVTKIGGPVGTLQESLKQVNALTSGTNIKPLDDTVGCKWEKAGATCALLVTNEWGQTINSTKYER